MKGIGRVEGWKVKSRKTNEITWKKEGAKKEVSMWTVGLGNGKKPGYEVDTGNGKPKLTHSIENARKIAKRAMK